MTVATLVAACYAVVAIGAGNGSHLLQGEHASLRTTIGVVCGIMKKVFFAIRIVAILSLLLQVKGVVFEIVADLVLAQQCIVLFAAESAVTHHQGGVSPNQGVQPTKVGGEGIALGSSSLVQAVINKELVLGTDQEIVRWKELTIFAEKDGCSGVGFRITVASG